MAKQPDSRTGPAEAAAPTAAEAAPAAAEAAPAAATFSPVPVYDPRPDIARLSADLNQLQLSVRQIVEVNAIENVLCRGFSELREGLDGLRQGPDRTRLSDRASCRLDELRGALLSPDWAGATTLPVRDAPVQFIGAVDPSPADCGPAPPFRSYGEDRSDPASESYGQQPPGNQQGSAS